MGERGWSPLGPRRSRAGFEWQLTPSDSPLLARLLSLSWMLSAGFFGLFGASLCLLVAVSAGASPLISAVVSFVATVAAGGVVLSRLTTSRHGLVFLRLRAPEPSDPTRSVVEHARTRTLISLAAVGTLVHGTLVVVVSVLEYPLLAYAVPVALTYAGAVVVRWWLPTAGAFDTQYGHLEFTSFPRGTDARRRWHGAMETTVELEVGDLEGLYRFEVADTTIVVLSVAGGRLPVIAAVPAAVADRLECVVG